MGGRAGDEGTGFGERLKRLRVAAELTQAALAEQAGLNVFSVAIIEQGHRDPAWATVLALAETLNASPNDSQVQRPLPDTRPATAEPSPATQGKGKR